MAVNSIPGMVDFDGRTGEGGGQVVRIALALSAITRIPIRIHHIRGKRPGKHGGLKAQHAACVSSLALACNASITGGEIGSQTLEFIPSPIPLLSPNRHIKIDTDSAGSSLLIFQSLFPFLLYAAGEPITVTIRGGTNVSFSLSYDYLDQVLLPSLECLGVEGMERKMGKRGWSQGSRQIGEVEFVFRPLGFRQSLKTANWPKLKGQPKVMKIDITIVVPEDLREYLKDAMTSECSKVFPDVPTDVVINEDSGHKARIYTLLVAHTKTGFRFGRDWLYDKKVTLPPDKLATQIAKKVVGDLDREIQSGRGLDEFLQDQLVIFQALAKGMSSVNGDTGIMAAIQKRDSESADGNLVDKASRPMSAKETSIPFGDGSMHTKTARWVVSQLLPGVRWYDQGRICEGVGWAVKSPENSNESEMKD